MNPVAFVALAVALLLAGCAVDRPQVIEAGPDQEAVALPNGGLLLLARRRQEQAPQCFARARTFRGLVQMPCDLAEMTRP